MATTPIFDPTTDEDMIDTGPGYEDNDLLGFSNVEAYLDAEADMMDDGWMEAAYDDLTDIGDDY